MLPHERLLAHDGLLLRLGLLCCACRLSRPPCARLKGAGPSSNGSSALDLAESQNAQAVQSGRGAAAPLCVAKHRQGSNRPRLMGWKLNRSSAAVAASGSGGTVADGDVSPARAKASACRNFAVQIHGIIVASSRVTSWQTQTRLAGPDKPCICGPAQYDSMPTSVLALPARGGAPSGEGAGAGAAAKDPKSAGAGGAACVDAGTPLPLNGSAVAAGRGEGRGDDEAASMALRLLLEDLALPAALPPRLASSAASTSRTDLHVRWEFIIDRTGMRWCNIRGGRAQLDAAHHLDDHHKDVMPV